MEGSVVVSTCNRTEFYIATKNIETGKNSLINFVSKYSNCSLEALQKSCYIKECKKAVHHLFRVAAGLDSMILGESQIQGQIQDAYKNALEFGMSNSVLNTLFQKAILVGKRVRSETCIDRQAISVSSAAVSLAKQIFDSLSGRTVLILGAGETSELTVRHLIANGVSTVVVANRTYERAFKIAQEFGGKAIHLDDFSQYLTNADIIISCTASPRYILSKKDIEPLIAQMDNKQILFIDIAVPRDINPDVLQLNNISLYDVDDLQHVVYQNLEERKREALKAEIIINEEIESFFNWLNSLFVVPTIVGLRNKANHIKEKELVRVLKKLDYLSEKEKRIIISLANSIINQLLHSPIANLKYYAHDENGVIYRETINLLFELDKRQLPSMKLSNETRQEIEV